MCRSDHHLRTGDIAMSGFPILGGHEGAGVVVALGEEGAIAEATDGRMFKKVIVALGRSAEHDLGAWLRSDSPTPTTDGTSLPRIAARTGRRLRAPQCALDTGAVAPVRGGLS